MLDNNNIIKYFVRVPEGVEFNGAEVSNANKTNRKKIYFDENTQQIWVKGKAFSLDKAYITAINTLIGDDADMSVRAIAQDVINNIANWQGADADSIINTLKEVLDWFNNLPEGDEGALTLVARVGKPAEDAKNAIYSFESFSSQEKTTKYGEGTVEVIELRNDGATVKVLTNTDLGNSGVDFVGQLFNVNSLDESTVLQLFSTEGLAQPIWVTVEKISDEIPAQAATGLYKVIEDAINAIDLSPYATKSEVNATIGDLGNKVEAQPTVYYTQEECDEHNTSLPNYWTIGTVKIPAVEAQNATYSFESYDSQEKTTKYGEGTVEVTELRQDGATVKVLTNEPTNPNDSNAGNFIGQSFNVNSLDETEIIQLYSTEDVALPIWVTVTKESDAIEAQPAVYYTQEECDAHNTSLPDYWTTGTIKTLATSAIPYTNVGEVLADLNTKVNTLTSSSITNIKIGTTNVTVSNNTATITKSNLQAELFDNTYASDALSYSYLGVTVSAKESNGELTEIKVDPSELVNRVSTIEDFDPWENYQAPVEPGE